MEFNSELIKSFSNQIKKLNLYKLPQYIWLVILYYLMLNVFFRYYQYFTQGHKELLYAIPVEVTELNALILTEFEKWIPFVWFLTVAFFFSGLFISPIKLLPYFKNKGVSYDVEYGISLSIWLFLIAITYELYSWLAMFFPFVVFILLLINLGLEKMNEKFENTF